MQQSTEVIQLATLAAVQRSTGICGWADTPLSKPVIQRVAITSGVTRGRCIERARIMRHCATICGNAFFRQLPIKEVGERPTHVLASAGEENNTPPNNAAAIPTASV
ncbi:hypothetical protein [Serratia liquefaciens]|uniref:hypothetical protein n=1 Tax=Serratia liquefaciens TaxID=614 RepID=UPI000959C7D4|nr:hypothetical protein [Serratia liquefaciens]OKP21695.1 hypothetical protein BSQ35_12800 [Serratia liquefaciens]